MWLVFLKDSTHIRRLGFKLLKVCQKSDFSGETDLLSRFEEGGVKDSNPLTSGY